MTCRSSLWPSGHWANFRNCEYIHIGRNTHLPDMTIMVALSWIIPLSDFNVALGYNLSRSKQVLDTHPRSRLHIHTKTVFTQLQQMFHSMHMCHRYSAYVCVCVLTSYGSKIVFQLYSGRCNMRMSPHSQTHVVVPQKNKRTEIAFH